MTTTLDTGTAFALTAAVPRSRAYNRSRAIAAGWCRPRRCACTPLHRTGAAPSACSALPMTKLIGISQSAPGDWKLTDLGWIFSIAMVFLGLSRRRCSVAGSRKVVRDGQCSPPGCAVGGGIPDLGARGPSA